MHAGLSGLRAVLAVLVLSAALAPSARGDAFEACIETLPPREYEDEYGDGFGFDYDDEIEDQDEQSPKLTLADLCHDIHATIATSELAPFLPEDWADRVTPTKLLQWRELLAPSSATAGRRPDPAAVAPILTGIQTAQLARTRTLWERFKDWLKRVLERQGSSTDTSWLDEWLREHAPSERVLRWIFTGLAVVLILVVLWIIYVELREAGLLGRRATPGARPGGAAVATGPQRRLPTLADASDEELPAVLVALLLEQLRRLGWMQDRHSMTHRELARAARFQAPADGETFGALVAASERLRYAATAPGAETLRDIVDAARRLLESVSRLPRSTT
ncbi:MAG: DUF4129 domain-containing protein [Steroidobacteraceae bacterium]